MLHFKDRVDGGRQLAGLLKDYQGRADVVVVGLARGGVVTAGMVSDGLDLPLDVVVVRKLGVPGEEELALGALAEDGVVVLNNDLIRQLDVPDAKVRMVIAKEKQELAYRVSLYRAQIEPIDVTGKTVLVVDDGIATGATMEAAIKLMRNRGAARVVVATVVTAIDTIEQLRQLADEIVYLGVPTDFWSIGQFYDDFHQLTHEEVIDMLRDARKRAMKRATAFKSV